MYKNVLFDLDGTLLNTIDDLADAANHICAAHGWPLHDVTAYKHFVGNGIPKLVERFSPTDCRDAETQALVLREFEGRYAAHMQDKTAPYPGLPQLLERLRAAGVRMAVYSNKEDGLAGQVVAHYFGADVFDLVRGARPGIAPKPAAEGTLALLAELSWNAAETLYVGDSNVDMATAQNAGMVSCGVLWGFRDEQELTAAGAVTLAGDAEELYEKVLG